MKGILTLASLKQANPTTLLTLYQGMGEKDQKTFREYLAAYERGAELGKTRPKRKRAKEK